LLKTFVVNVRVSLRGIYFRSKVRVILKLKEKLLTSFGKSHTVYKEGEKIQIIEIF